MAEFDPALTDADQAFMAGAISLAKRGRNSCDPNPAVGCVLVKDQRIIGQGWHQFAGEAHAEINALNAAQAADVVGCTAYVTLEPCSHQGRTGPCANALVKAGVARVVAAMTDPNPLVAGDGFKILQNAGISVVTPCLEVAARALNPGFIQRMQSQRPFVRCKLAMSLDGRTAMASGESQWITGSAARQDVQNIRARSSAIISGIDTVIMDAARLTVRGENNPRQPLRVILDSRLRLDPNAALLTEPSPIWLVSASTDQRKLTILQQSHPDLSIKQFANPQGQTDLAALLQGLADAQCNEVLIEAGATLAGAFLQAGLIDELLVYMAPTVMGDGARGLFNLPQLSQMQQRYHLKWQDVRMVGDDIRITATLKK